MSANSSDKIMLSVAAHDARELAARYKIPLDVDFHALDSATVERLVAAADILSDGCGRVWTDLTWEDCRYA